MVSRLVYTPVRHSHLITTFGPGALSVTENGVTVLTSGPRTWLRSYRMERPLLNETIDDLTIRDSYMETRLGVHRIVAPWPLSEDPSTKSDWLIPAVRFPLAEFCRNAKCRRMHWSDQGDWKIGQCNVCTTRRGKKPPTTQVPIVLACQNGHLSDVPWSSWVHDGSECGQAILRYRQNASPRRPTVDCLTCGRSRTMGDQESFACSGARPWLPGLAPEDCQLNAQLVERSSTSIYFADTASSLAIPPVAGIRPVILRHFRNSAALRQLRAVYTSGNQLVLDQMASVCALLGVETDAQEVALHLDALALEEVQVQAADEDEIRSRELDALLSSRPRVGRGKGQPDLIVEPIEMTRFADAPLMSRISAVSVIPRLREIQVLKGFSRINPVNRSPAEGYAQMWGAPQIDEELQCGAGWLPGYEVFGEGILVELDSTAWRNWVFDNRESARIHDHALYPDGLHPERVLVHTLAHLVIRAAAPLSGYSQPSIRERIYDHDGRLAFLIYTTVGDIEGTMGGLASLGQPGRLEALMTTVVEMAAWCTTDPVCIESSPPPGLPTTTKAGACHHCLLLPETSCEIHNRRLDRAVVIGTPDDDCGFLVD